MGIYIKDIEMPKEPDEMIELAIFGDGKTAKTGESWRSPVDGKCYYGPSKDMNTYSALAVSSHGRLIDADALTGSLSTLLRFPSNLVNGQWIVNTIREQPTIIEAEEGE